MTSDDLRPVAEAVLKSAQKHNSVSPSDVRAALERAGFPGERWKEVVVLLGQSLRLQCGRYYPATGKSPSQADPRQSIADLVTRLVKSPNTNGGSDRRDKPRTPFQRPLKATFEDGRQALVHCKDVSAAGICLVSEQSLLGKKLRVEIPIAREPEETLSVNVRIVWTSATAAGVYENGGAFLPEESG